MLWGLHPAMHVLLQLPVPFQSLSQGSGEVVQDMELARESSSISLPSYEGGQCRQASLVHPAAPACVLFWTHS